MRKILLLGGLLVSVLLMALIATLESDGDRFNTSLNSRVNEDDGGSGSILVSGALRAYDASDIREVAGFFDQIFLARVTENLGSQALYQKFMVMTQYKVEVLHVMKGEVPGNAVVSVEGGYYDGKWHESNGDSTYARAVDEDEADELQVLEVGKVYMFATSYNSKRDWYTVGTSRYAKMLLPFDEGVTPENLASKLNEDPRYQEMKEAIANQISPEEARALRQRAQ